MQMTANSSASDPSTVDAPDAALRPESGALLGLSTRRSPEELGHLLGRVDIAHLFRKREAFAQELRRRLQVALLLTRSR